MREHLIEIRDEAIAKIKEAENTILFSQAEISVATKLLARLEEVQGQEEQETQAEAEETAEFEI